MKIRSRKRILWLIFGGIAIAAAVHIVRLGAVLDLELDGRKLVDSAAGYNTPVKFDREICAWISNTEVVRVIEHRTTSNVNPRSMPRYTPDTVETINVDTGKKQRKSTLENLLSSDVRFKDMGLAWTSPDGQWSLWSSHMQDAPYTWIAARMDGRETREWKKPASDFGSPSAWLPDSSGWVRMRNSGPRLTHAEIHSLNKPADVKVIPLSDESVGGTLLGWLPDGRLQLGTWGDSAWTTRTYFGILDVKAPKVNPDRFSLDPFGPDCKAMSIAMNRQGDRLSWILIRRPRATWLAGVMRSIGMDTDLYGRIELWTTGPKGQNPRLIGTCRAQLRDKRVGAGVSSTWSPDGKRLMFTLHGAVRSLTIN